MHSRRKAKLRVASDGGRGVFRWPGRALLPSEQLSNMELYNLARDPQVGADAPGVARIARLNFGARIKAKWRAYKNRRARGRVAR